MRVGIIGGGAAGLAAAYELTKQGHYAEVKPPPSRWAEVNWSGATITYSSATPT